MPISRTDVGTNQTRLLSNTRPFIQKRLSRFSSEVISGFSCLYSEDQWQGYLPLLARLLMVNPYIVERSILIVQCLQSNVTVPLLAVSTSTSFILSRCGRLAVFCTTGAGYTESLKSKGADCELWPGFPAVLV